MEINHFNVLRVAGQDVHACGELFVDSPLNSQDELLAELTEKDRRQIGLALRVIGDPRERLPAQIQFHLRYQTANRTDLAGEPDFKTEAGRDAWVKRQL